MNNVRRNLVLTANVLTLLMLSHSNIAVAQGPNLITNGSFEMGSCIAPSFQLVHAPDTTTIPGWEVFSQNVHWMCNNNLWESFDGIRDIDLDGATGSQGGMRQIFPTEVGATYHVTFYMAANNHAPPAVKTMQVSVANVTENFSFDSTGIPPFGLTASHWQMHTFPFTSLSTMTTLAFQSTTSPSGWGPALDNVSVEKVEVALEVPVDIKPQGCPNPLNCMDKGVLPVAILGTDSLDVTQIDPVSIKLEGIAPLRWSIEDVATPFEPFTGKETCLDCTNWGADGYMDLTLKFDVQAVIRKRPANPS